MLNWPLALFAASLDILTWWECSRTLPWIQRSSSRSWSCVMSLARPGFFWFVSQSIPSPDFLLVSTFLFSFLSICSFSTSLTGFLCLPAPFFLMRSYTKLFVGVSNRLSQTWNPQGLDYAHFFENWCVCVWNAAVKTFTAEVGSTEIPQDGF